MSISLNREETSVVPDWCSYFCETEYSAFIQSIGNYFEKLNVMFRIADYNLYLEGNNPGFGDFKLVELSKLCKQYDPMYYEEIVRTYFTSLLREDAYKKSL